MEVLEKLLKKTKKTKQQQQQQKTIKTPVTQKACCMPQGICNAIQRFSFLNFWLNPQQASSA